VASITRSMALARAMRPIARQQSPLAFAFAGQKTRIAAFHNTARKAAFIPPGPQVIQGTINDPVPVPGPRPTEGGYHWDFERLVAIGIIPLTAAPFVGQSLSPITDAVLCSLLLVHSHIGFEACIIDYFPHQKAPKLHSLFMWMLRAGTVLAGAGLYSLETNDVGLTATVTKIWHA